MQRHQPTISSLNPARTTTRRLIFSISLAVLFATTNAPVAKAAEVGIGAADAQWKLVVSSVVSVFASSVIFKEDTSANSFVLTGATGAPGLIPNNEVSFRVRSGFNPTQVNLIMLAPENKVADVAFHFMLATSQQSSKTSFVGNTIETRILEIRMSGKGGQLSIGKGLNLFERSGTLNDRASMFGIGYQPTPDTAGPGFGHIGTGYTWVDFSARIAYATPNWKGLKFEVGIFDPFESAPGVFGGGTVPEALGAAQDTLFSFAPAFETPAPRLEAEFTYGKPFAESGLFQLWLGGLWQVIKSNDLSKTGSARGGVDVDQKYQMYGGNLGLTLGGKGATLRAHTSYTAGAGTFGFFGAGVNCLSDAATLALFAPCEVRNTAQGYVAFDYNIVDSGWAFGVSFGGARTFKNTTLGGILEGITPGFFTAGQDIDSVLIDAFVHYQILPFQTIIFGYDYFNGSPLGLGVFPYKQVYHAASVGTQIIF